MMQSPINVRIVDEKLWSRFHPNTEMIVTKKGRSIFPKLAFQVEGLMPLGHYAIQLHFYRCEDIKFKYDNGVWAKSSSAEPIGINSVQIIRHPDGVRTGEQWMRSAVEFARLKITNNINSKEPSHYILQSMHKYRPVLTVIQMPDNSFNMLPEDSPYQQPFSFHLAEFYAVTAYQNNEVTRLKIANNKYARGFRAENSRKRAAAKDEKEQNSPQDELFENPAKRMAWQAAPYYQPPQYMPYGAADMSNFYYPPQDQMAAYNTYPMAAYQQMGTEQMTYNAAACWPMMPTTFHQSPDTTSTNHTYQSISP